MSSLRRLFILATTMSITLVDSFPPRVHAFQADDPKAKEAAEASASETPRLRETTELSVTWSESKDKLHGFSKKTGRWSILEIEPQEYISPISLGPFAYVELKNSVAAYSPVAGRWDVLDVSAQPPNRILPSENTLSVQTKEHLYTFSTAKGLWTSPTDPEFQQGATRYQLSNKELWKIVHEKFDAWINAIPPHRFRWISVEGHSQGLFIIKSERQSLLKEAESKLKEIEAEALKSWKPSGNKMLSAAGRLPSRVENASANDLASADESIKKLKADCMGLEEVALRTAKDLQKQNELDDSSRAKLTDSVEQSFDARHQLQTLEAKNARLQLDLVDQQIAARQKNRENIVARRVDELLDPDGTSVSWFQSTNKPETLFGPRSPVKTVERSSTATQTYPIAPLKPLAPKATYPGASPTPMDPSDLSEKLHAARNSYFEATTALDRMRRQLGSTHPKIVEESERIEPVAATALSLWKQVWASYESQGRLLKMDVDKAEAEQVLAKSNYNRVRVLVSKNASTDHELEAEYLKVKVAEIAPSRATEILNSFDELEKIDPFLNPASIEKEKKDDTTR